MNNIKARRPSVLAQPACRRRATFGILALCSIALSPQILAAQEAPDWVQEAETRWWSAMKAGDARALRSLFSADVVFLDHNQTVRGRQDVEGFVRALFAARSYDCEGALESVQVLDKLATVLSSASCTAIPRDGREPFARSLRFLKVYERQDDGSWLIVRVSDQPSLQP